MFWTCVEGGITATMTMFEKLNFMKPLVIGGAAAAAIAVMPVAAAEASVGSPASAGPTHSVFKQDPGGSGCDANGNCGSGGVNGGPGGGPGGQGCIAGTNICGSGGQFAGPGGVPGGCVAGVGCGHG